MSLLEVEHLVKHFVGVSAIVDLSFGVDRAEILGLVGPNGAGKTTLFNLITGFLSPSQGEIRFKGHSIARLKPHKVVALGITKTFQIPKPFHSLSCLDNVMVSLLSKSEKSTGERKKLEARAREIIERIGLRGKSDLMPEALTQGDLKVLEVARALATEPEILLLDEPFAGLSMSEIDQLTAIIENLHGSGMTIIIVEHKLRELMRIVKRVMVLDFGEKIADGTPEEISNDDRVVEAYLGSGGTSFASA